MSTDVMNTLERRITASLVGDITSADLATLISETEAAIAEADATAEMERTKALDLTVSPDATTARETMQAAEFTRDRLRAVLPKLKERLSQVAEQEYAAKWHAKYEALKIERDALAAKLRAVYPEFETKISGLFARIAANDEQLSRRHQARPAGFGLHLRGAELEARGMEGFTRYQPSIAATLKLPAFEPGERLAWPPPQRPTNPASLAPMAMGEDKRLCSAEWWKVKEEQAQAAAERVAREEKEQEAKALESHHEPRW
jgi:hypothetical protein